MNKIHEIMGEDKNLVIDKKLIEQIKKEIISSIEQYVDLKLKPVIDYFKKKRDFNKMSYL
ncbi:MAG: hypothetical protein ACFFCE_00335 [Promethearchaeota archaeon]